MESMMRALAEFEIEGVKTTIPFCLSVLQNSDFQNGVFDTQFVEKEFDKRTLRRGRKGDEIAAVIAAVLLQTGAQALEAIQTNHRKETHSSWKNQRQELHR
jgi:acetyl/propionyl-CoA carboxylase alpha subunit